MGKLWYGASRRRRRTVWSRDTGIGRAGGVYGLIEVRSAVYFEQGDYEFALYNIDLAKKHDYPEKIMPKLRGTVPSPRMDINVDTNPKIPFLAKGKKVDHRRILVAEKDFNPGDVIMDAEPLLTAIDFNLCYENCSHCGVKFSNSLIPCPGSVFFMYCGEECRQKSCGINSNVRNLDRRELFRILHTTEARRDPIGELNGYLEEKLISYGYFLVFQANPLMVTVTTGSIPANIHTCDPNAHTAFESGRMKMVLLRPVPAGKPFVEVVRTNLVEFQPGTTPPRNALYFRY
ncbi:conserved hypothetical protein [Culex quinquefasciatus]|uniref:Uncharacterized protein n=1 Tax=Culex quinquefasciatus TaxID=7176 RepID=B0XFA5_CULQU|nr:conserved hypothetical protein [Culex quinquefasciatus]|eukprot:XP_001868327.1 conserved hypothetical protein [Culex quinquefasciatus]